MNAKSEAREGQEWRIELAKVLESVEGKPTAAQWAWIAELLPEEEWGRLMDTIRTATL